MKGQLMNGAFWHDWEVEVLAQWESIVYSSGRPPIDGSDTVGLLSPNFCTIDPTTDGALTRLHGALFPILSHHVPNQRNSDMVARCAIPYPFTPCTKPMVF